MLRQEGRSAVMTSQVTAAPFGLALSSRDLNSTSLVGARNPRKVRMSFLPKPRVSSNLIQKKIEASVTSNPDGSLDAHTMDE